MTASRQQEVGQPHAAGGKKKKYDDDHKTRQQRAPPLSLFRCTPTIGPRHSAKNQSKNETF